MTLKPMKRNEHIIPLSREHHFTLLFSWKIKQGIKKEVDLGRITAYVAHFWEHYLSIHFKEEEETLFAVVKDELVQKALKEHEEFRALLEELKEEKDKDKLKSLLLHLAEVVIQHVRFEERELFPHLEKMLSEEQLAKIGHDLLDMQPEPLQDNYNDEFWMD